MKPKEEQSEKLMKTNYISESQRQSPTAWNLAVCVFVITVIF